MMERVNIPVRRARWTALVALVAIPAAVPPTVVSQITYPEPACYAHLTFSNHYRRVFGTIAAECPGSIHSAPFGNWGVASNYGRRYDGNQFAGWKKDGNTRHWNSCTTHFRPDGTMENYNDPPENPTRQKAKPDVAHVYAATQWPMGDSSWTCQQAAGNVIRTYLEIGSLFEFEV